MQYTSTTTYTPPCKSDFRAGAWGPMANITEAAVTGPAQPAFPSLMASKLVLGIALLAFTAACQLPGQSSCSNTMIDWVNFIQVGSTQYVSGPQPESAVQETDLGPVYATVKFKVDGNICDPGYKLKDGDAAFLDPGTSIYQVNGHAAAEQLAAKFRGTFVVYRAMTPAR
jgi:hypothetical protein